MTRDQIEKLHKAVDLAQDAGSCQYVKNNQPCCVVGQYCFLNGISIQTMECWHQQNITNISRWNLPLSLAEIDILGALQIVWDSSAKSTDEIRMKMHYLIDHYCQYGK